jgi:hypothetical protein
VARRKACGGVGYRAQFLVQRARDVAGRELPALADVHQRAEVDGCCAHHVVAGQRESGRLPRSDPAVELTGDALIADLEALPDDLVRVLVLVADEHEWALGVSEPAQPGGERGPERDRQRAG